MSNPADTPPLPEASATAGVPGGYTYAPVDAIERRAAEDQNAIQFTKAVWDSILSRLDGKEVTPDSIQNITGLNADQAAAIYTGIRARNKLEYVEPPRSLFKRKQIGHYMLNLKREPVDPRRVPPDAPWGVVVVDHELNHHDTGNRYPAV